MSSQALRQQFFSRRIILYRKDPVLFAREVVGFEPDEWQEQALRDLAESNRISIKSGQGVGKTSFEAIALLWFLCCFPFPRIVATAPTKQQLHDVLWSEVSKWMGTSPLLNAILKWTKTYIYMRGQEKRWFAVARTATKPENMQGFHADNMLFIIDEASGVDDAIMEAVLGTLSGDNNKLIMCGNPTRTSGTFYESFHNDKEIYRRQTVSSLDSARTSKENIDSLIRKYGADSNVARVRIYGEFPTQEDDVFIPISLIEGSIRTEFKPKKKPFMIHIGCDVARFGDDKTVIAYKVDEKLSIYKKRRGQDLMRTADDIVLLGEQLVTRYKFDSPIPVKIDDGGLGGGVTDRLRQLKRNFPDRLWWLDIIPVTFGKRIRHKYYYDSTTYMMSVVKSMLSPYTEHGEPKPVELILPNDDDLVGQLSTRKYQVTDDSKIRIESKDAVKKRGQPSPDEADCVLLCCLPVKPLKIRKSEDLFGEEARE